MPSPVINFPQHPSLTLAVDEEKIDQRRLSFGLTSPVNGQASSRPDSPFISNFAKRYAD